MNATGDGGNGPSRLRAVKNQAGGTAPGIGDWMREVRRRCVALKPASGLLPVSVLHQGAYTPSGQQRVFWRASCDLATAETDEAATAMQALLDKLDAQLDERIKTQGEELARLQDARRRGLKVAGGE